MSLKILDKIKKYNQFPNTYIEVIGKKMGGIDNLKAVIRGKKRIILQDMPPIAFDKHGRLIRPNGTTHNVCDANKDFYVQQPQINFAERLELLRKHLHGKLVVHISSSEYEDRAKKILQRIEGDEQMNGVLNGPYTISVLPRLSKKMIANYGLLLEEIFLPAVAKAYTSIFAPKPFKNYRAGTLAGQVNIVEGSRHETLLQKALSGDVVFLHALQPLQGYSILAQREIMQFLPDDVLLGGAIDTSCSLIQFTPELVRDAKTPAYDCSALQWQSADYSLYFYAVGVELGCDGQSNLGDASDYYSGGLLFVG